jgi:Flavodoxin reductases (ferredoxin-NADPH reductases) family 1
MDANALVPGFVIECMETRVSVTSVTDVGPDTVAIRFEAPAGFEAAPGQFVKLGDEVEGEEYNRFYTLSSPDVSGEFETTIEVDLMKAGHSRPTWPG